MTNSSFSIKIGVINVRKIVLLEFFAFLSQTALWLNNSDDSSEILESI